jgi:hypothetical protein
VIQSAAINRANTRTAVRFTPLLQGWPWPTLPLCGCSVRCATALPDMPYIGWTILFVLLEAATASKPSCTRFPPPTPLVQHQSISCHTMVCSTLKIYYRCYRTAFQHTSFALFHAPRKHHQSHSINTHSFMLRSPYSWVKAVGREWLRGSQSRSGLSGGVKKNHALSE